VSWRRLTALAYVEQALRQAGVKPMGDAGGYRQRYVVTRATLIPQETNLRMGDRTFAYGTDFVLTSFLTPRHVVGRRRLRRRRDPLAEARPRSVRTEALRKTRGD
jgi:hypothetical protein